MPVANASDAEAVLDVLFEVLEAAELVADMASLGAHSRVAADHLLDDLRLKSRSALLSKSSSVVGSALA
jgi:hypothetical protein